jgi:hypothetical protein
MRHFAGLLAVLNLPVCLLGAAAGDSPDAKPSGDKWVLLGQPWDFKKVEKTFRVVSGRHDADKGAAVWVLENLKADLAVHNSVSGGPFKVVFLDSDNVPVGAEAKVGMTAIGAKIGETFRLSVAMPDEAALKRIKSVQVLSRTSLID